MDPFNLQEFQQTTKPILLGGGKHNFGPFTKRKYSPFTPVFINRRTKNRFNLKTTLIFLDYICKTSTPPFS